MNTLSNNFTSQKVYQYKGTNLQSIKLPNIRKPYTALNLGLAGVSDSKIDTLYAALEGAYKTDNKKRILEMCSKSCAFYEKVLQNSTSYKR